MKKEKKNPFQLNLEIQLMKRGDMWKYQET